MNLYLIRHADALPIGDRAASDAERPLSPDGESQSQLLAFGLHRRGVKLARVLSSPLVRARQTAELLIRGWSPPPQLDLHDELAPDGKRRKLARFLAELKERDVGLVGHQPDLGVLAAWLIGNKRVHIDLAKAGVACISCDNGPGKGEGTLEWLITPAWLKG